MPELDGFVVFERLRAQSEVLASMLSALSDVVDCIIGLQLGADDHIVRPFRPKDLEVHVRRVMKRLAFNETCEIVSMVPVTP
jgi:two-component system OmpR family response regulator